MNKMISTIPALIDALGGKTAVGAHLLISVNAVCNWVANDEIPVGWHLRLWLWAEDRGLVVDRAVFGMTGRYAAPPRGNGSAVPERPGRR